MDDSSSKPYDDADRLEQLYWREGLTVEEVADRLDCGATTVRRFMDKHGIKRRKRGDNSQKPAHFRTILDGYEVWVTHTKSGSHTVRVHRLQAVAHYGLEAIRDRHVHHRNGVPWDNRVENFEFLEKGEHHSLHAQEIPRNEDGPGHFVRRSP